MIEAGVTWPKNAEYVTQDKDTLKINFYRNGKPNYIVKLNSWMADNCIYMYDKGIALQSLCRNWHQTIVTREQYAKALTDAAIQIEDNHYNSITEQIPIKTIEQLASDYHTLAAEAECLQLEADATLKLANEALVTLQKAGELIGLVISVDTLQKCTEQHQQPVITDWHDLQVGNVIKLTGSSNPCWKEHSGHEMTVTNIYPYHSDYDAQVILSGSVS